MTGPVAFSAEGSRRLKNAMIDTAWAHLDREAAMMDPALKTSQKMRTQAHLNTWVTLLTKQHGRAQRAFLAVPRRIPRVSVG